MLFLLWCISLQFVLISEILTLKGLILTLNIINYNALYLCVLSFSNFLHKKPSFISVKLNWFLYIGCLIG